jgi:hypothetical protein
MVGEGETGREGNNMLKIFVLKVFLVPPTQVYAV